MYEQFTPDCEQLPFALRNIYVGTGDILGPAYVWGNVFGSMLLAVASSLEDCLNEADERFGERADPDDPALLDYDDGLEGALACGDARVNDGGTTVWIDPYEWIREFPNVREAGDYIRGIER